VASAPATPPAGLLFRSSVAATPSTPPAGGDAPALDPEVEPVPVLVPAPAAAGALELSTPVCATELDVRVAAADCAFVDAVPEPQPALE
jgi:hypothetical protein